MQMSDTAAIKTGLACSKTGITVHTAKPPFAAGDIVASKLTQSDVWQGRTGFW